MKKFNYSVLATAMALSMMTAGCQSTVAEQAPEIAVEQTTAMKNLVDLPYSQFTMKNGLRVIVHEDRKAPIVSVGVWYNVGSKNEPAGKTGFAHLFEHLMFNGSENANYDYFKPLQEIGATGLNGTTWFDRTNYYETVPTSALDVALFMESDRMGHLTGAISQDKLDEQRKVVQNEKRQGDSSPYGMSEYRILEGLFPAGHPYRHSTIGSMADLDAASLDDVKEWFKKYYGAANTVIVLAGDINAETAKIKMEKYFGDIAAGDPLHQMKSMVPERTLNTSEEMFDNVSQTRITWNWAVPGRTTKEATELSLAAAVLGDGKSSRLYKALIHDGQLATSTYAYLEKHSLASTFSISVTLKTGGDIEQIEQKVEALLADYLENGPTDEEMARLKTVINGGVIRSLESVSGKASTLAQGLLYANDANFVNTELAWIANAKPADIQKTSTQWLSDGYYKLTVKPFGKHETAESTLDRSQFPVPGKPIALTLPEVKTATLSNGIEVFVSERHSVPVLEMSMVFDGGNAANTKDKKGLASFTMGMMNEGTTSLGSLALAETKERLGASISASSNLDQLSITASVLKDNAAESVNLWADVVQNPAFIESDMKRDQSLTVEGIKTDENNPRSVAFNLLKQALYGAEHAYGFNAAGTEESVMAITKEDMVAFHKAWIRADNAKIFVSGDTNIEEITALLEASFGKWQVPSDSKGKKSFTDVTLAKKAKVILVDRPNSPQSMIVAGHLMPSSGADNYLELETMNGILGGTFTARMNMNLREDKGWAYGAYTGITNARGQRLWYNYAPVQTDKTAAAMSEIIGEVTNYRAKKPATQAELDLFVNSKTLTLPGRFEKANTVLRHMVSNDDLGREQNSAEKLQAKYDAMTPAMMAKLAKSAIKPEAMVWVVIGDLSKVEANIRKLKLGDIEIWDEKGNKLK
jgi:zinc protease